MPVPLVVPDASVILKWVLRSEDEPDVVRAIALRDAILSGDVEARVPTLWLYEVGNTLARRFPEQAEHVLDVLSRFNLVSAPRTTRWMKVVLDLTNQYGVTFYDAAYHAHSVRFVRRAPTSPELFGTLGISTVAGALRSRGFVKCPGGLQSGPG